MLKNISLIALIAIISFQGQAQHWKWSVGLNNTAYQYKTKAGVDLDNFKSTGGVHASFRYNKELVDTTDLISKFSKTAIFFGNHQKLAKIASMFRYELGANLNQFNASVDVRNTVNSYQASFIGLTGAFGPEIKLYKGFSIALQGNVSVQKLFTGTQTTISNNLNANFDLADNEDFNPIHFMMGYSVEIHKLLSDKTSVFVQYQKSSTFHSWSEGNASLNFAPSTIAIGIKLSKF